jgi:single-stranded-DNA-specific exonuclease
MKWVLAEHDEALSAALAGESGIHPLIARLMVNRGVTDPASARAFLECDPAQLSSPGVFAGMEKALDRIRRATARGERIVVYGDYDVDGVTGTALLFLVLKRIGAMVDCYIPDRISEGYGVNSAALRRIRESGTALVITVDCGISARDQAAEAALLGLDLIITDHHEIADADRPTGPDSDSFILPDAYSLLHPRLLLPNVSDAVRESVSSLTGVGVAFKLAQALLGADARDEQVQELLDLVTLGTIADVGRITGENRVLVRHGLERLSRQDGSQRPGIAALKQVSGLAGKRITAGMVGFTLAPRINASGRLERADMAFRLLTTSSADEAAGLAAELDAVNRERQSVEERIQKEARRLCKGHDLAATGAFVLTSSEWHPGVIGIVASRIVEEFYRPTALICIRDGVGKGSARSIPGFDLYHGLLQCEHLLSGFGGHKYAAGFTIAEERVPEFRERLGALVMESVGRGGFLRTQIVDGPVGFDELTADLVRQVEKLAPFGQGNPEPRLGARGLEVVSSRIVGNGHLKMRLRHETGIALDAIAFNRGSLLGKTVKDGARIAAVFTPRINGWNGSTAVELEIKDLRIDAGK